MNEIQQEFREIHKYLADIFHGDTHPQTWIELTDKLTFLEKHIAAIVSKPNNLPN